jgi:O-6-methylguanine DNA methyltransferase
MAKNSLNKKTFTDKVLEVVKKIPKGKVMTYKQVAIKAGNPKGSRAVGTIMSKNADKNIPCHRVIRSDGTIGEYNGLQGKDKRVILLKEGVKL